MSTEPDACGRYMPIPEYYNETEMFRCSECGKTLPTQEAFLGDGCQRVDYPDGDSE